MSLLNSAARLSPLALALVLGCSSSPTAREDDGTCPKPAGEFAAHACARVSGRVLTPAGQPVEAILVTPVYPETGARGGYNTYASRTDAQGRFSLLLHRFGTVPGAAPVTPDTLTVQLRAADPADPAGPAGADGRVPNVLVPVRLEFAPIGAPIRDVEVTIPFARP